jgi:hypothetical protein
LTAGPADPDVNGLYEDVDGDGQATIPDVVAFHSAFDGSVVAENCAAFDFTGNSRISFSTWSPCWSGSDRTGPRHRIDGREPTVVGRIALWVVVKAQSPERGPIRRAVRVLARHLWAPSPLARTWVLTPAAVAQNGATRGAVTCPVGDTDM